MWTYKSLFILLFLTYSLAGLSQVCRTIGKPYPEKMDELSLFHRKIINHLNLHDAKDTIRKMHEMAAKLDDQELKLEIQFLEGKLLASHDKDGIALLENLYDEVAKHQIDHLKLRIARYIANDYWRREKFENAIKWNLKLSSLLKKVDPSEFPQKPEYLLWIGTCYYFFGDYHVAILYFKDAASLIEINKEYVWFQTINNLGLSYQQLGAYEDAARCFESIIEKFTSDVPLNENKNAQWIGIAKGNLGQNYYLQKDLTRALPLILTDYSIALTHKDYGLAAGAATTLANIYFLNKDMKNTKRFVDDAYQFSIQSKQTDRLRHIFPIYSKYYAFIQQPTLAIKYLDSSLIATKNYSDKFNAVQLMNAKEEALASQKNAEIFENNIKNAEKIHKRNLLIAGMIILTLIVMLTYIRYQNWSKKEINKRDEKIKNTESELLTAKKALEEMANKAVEKSALNPNSSNNDVVEKLNQQVILTDEGWKEFSRLFAKVHPGFQHRIKSKFPQLTPAELRCLSMERLQFSNKQMAALQGVSENAVLVTKHRIRKRLGFENQKKLFEFVRNI